MNICQYISICMYRYRYSIDGSAVAYELLGQARPNKLKDHNISSDILTWHFLMRNELLFQKYLPSGDDEVRFLCTQISVCVYVWIYVYTYTYMYIHM
jgi:hypothetical protein